MSKTHGKLLKFSRGFWQQAVDCRGCEPFILTHYDILKAVAEGKSYNQIAIKYHVSKKHVVDIVKKYR